MEGSTDYQDPVASVEDLLAFVDRASATVRAVLGRPSKTKSKVNLKRYVQRQLHKCNDVSRYRTKGRDKRPRLTAPESESTNTRPLTPAAPYSITAQQTSFAGGSRRSADQYAEFRTFSACAPTVPCPESSAGTRHVRVTCAVPATPPVQRYAEDGSAVEDVALQSDSFHRGRRQCANFSEGCFYDNFPQSATAASEQLAGAFVDPVFPPENCDQIVPFIETELQQYQCCKSQGPNAERVGEVVESASLSPCIYEISDWTFDLLSEAVSSEAFLQEQRHAPSGDHHV